MTSTDQILALVRTALDKFEQSPLEGTVRRAIRIANALGESQFAVRLALELKPLGGDPAANAEDTRRLLVDAQDWTDPEGPTELAITEYCRDRQFPDRPDRPSSVAGKVLGHSLGELEFWEAERRSMVILDEEETLDAFFMRVVGEQVLRRTRHRAFTALCQWERQLTYSNTNERIFTRFQDHVDGLLSSGVPDILNKFNAVYRRLREAATGAPEDDASEEMSQVLTSCRRILEAIADHVWPPTRSNAAGRISRWYRSVQSKTPLFHEGGHGRQHGLCCP